MDWVIVPAEPADAPDILALQRLAYQSEADLYDDPNIPPMVETLEELGAEFGQSLFLKVMDQGLLVGSVRVRVFGDTARVGRLIVRPGWQGRGIGTLLMREVERLAPGHLELFTGHLSESNLRLYRRLGYREFRREPIHPALTLVFLEKLPTAAIG